MTIRQGVARNRDDIIHCDRLDEFFKEFVEYRKWKATTNNFNKNVFPFQEWKKATGNHPHNPEKDWYWKIFYLDLNFDNAFNQQTKNPIVYWEMPPGFNSPFDYSTGWDLGINVSKAFKIKKDSSLESSEWRQWNQQKEKIETILQDIWTTGEIKDTYGLDLNWPQAEESHLEEPKENSRKAIDNKAETQQSDKKTYWIIGSLATLSVLGLIVWLVLKKKNQKK